MVSVGLRVDENGIKQTGDTRRSKENLSKQFERLGPSTSGDRSHVPQHRPLGVEIGRDHKEPPPLTVGGSDIGQHCLIDLVSDDLLYRLSAVIHGLQRRAQKSSQCKPVNNCGGRHDFPETLVSSLERWQPATDCATGLLRMDLNDLSRRSTLQLIEQAGHASG